jgi:carbon-monoxide dehydrogenase large subunit
VLQIPLRHVSVYSGDTLKVERGIGTYGSRGAAVGGNAVYKNAITVKQKALLVAAKLLETSVEDVIVRDGFFNSKEIPSHRVSWSQVAALASESIDSLLTSRSIYEPEGFNATFGTHICVVRIDKETGEISILRYVSVDDCGNVINPFIVNGQIHGGITQGIGQVLWENTVYDDVGNLLSGSFMDYLIPTAENLPSFEIARTETPSPHNPLGVKGIGEAAVIGSTPAVANAILDALNEYGIKHLDLPLTPETIWSAITASK